MKKRISYNFLQSQLNLYADFPKTGFFSHLDILYLVVVTICGYYLVICVVFSFLKAFVLCRPKHRWEDICAFRAFPYKLQTSLQLFELVDDYIQSEINKPPLQATCTVSFSI